MAHNEGTTVAATELAQRLKAEIEKHQSARALARHIGMSNSTISRVLQGKKVDPNTLDKIAAYLNLPPADVYRMAEMLPPEPTLNELEAKRQLRIRQLISVITRLPEEDQRTLLDVIVMLPQLSEKSQSAVLAMIQALRDQET